ncbi:hypothetical protein H2203_003434 [Taxawa tesnikishii (nom. ined.)]|nr:hypothetical protein H2203_003434 [Dothideales sp. JES 119]
MPALAAYLTTFLIGSPWFEQLSICKTLKMRTAGSNADTAYCVQSLKVNGEQWDKACVTWANVFEDGGTMDFGLGPEPAM